MFCDIFWNKIRLQMRLLHIVDRRPQKQIKLEPIDPEDFSISLPTVQHWSPDNIRLYQLILQNGMAEFICNRDFLFEFYQSLCFDGQGISSLDPPTLRFTHLRVLSLRENKISRLSHLPSSCKELYIDFNELLDFELSGRHQLELLSASHNHLSDSALARICATFPQLRCLNVSYNQLNALKDFVNALGTLPYLKILAGFSNPLSMLVIYYSYVTEHLNLAYFDGAKYIKPEVQPVDPQPAVQLKKEQKQEKQDKKESKKDSKKAGKVQEKPPEPPKQQTIVPPPKKELTIEDFQRVRLEIAVSNLEGFVGNIYDSSLFPAGTDAVKTQTCFWVRYELMGESVELRQKAVAYEAATNDNNELRINLQCNINKQFSVNLQNHRLFSQGLKIQIYQTEPSMTKDSESLELKPVLNDSEILLTDSIVGGMHLDLRSLHRLSQKHLEYKFRLFPAAAIESPLFYDPFEDEEQRIDKQKQSFQSNLKAKEEQALKRLQEQEAALQQKKGKDQKKAADKKTGKKDGKDNTLGERPPCEKCNYPIFGRTYCVVENQKMFKGKELLCVALRVA